MPEEAAVAALGAKLRSLGFAAPAALARVLGIDLAGAEVLPTWSFAGTIRQRIVAHLEGLNLQAAAPAAGKEVDHKLADLALFFIFGRPLPRMRVEDLLGIDLTDSLSKPTLGLIVPADETSLISFTALLAPSVGVGGISQLLLFADHFSTSGIISAHMGIEPVMYVGPDTAALASLLAPEYHAVEKCSSVLDLCSGSGAQGLTAGLSGASRVRLIEQSHRAAAFARANAALNGFAGGGGGGFSGVGGVDGGGGDGGGAWGELASKQTVVEVVEGDATNWRNAFTCHSRQEDETSECDQGPLSAENPLDKIGPISGD